MTSAALAAALEAAPYPPRRLTLYRLVESQEKVATLRLVDSLDEQAQLEALLEGSKPPLPPGTDGKHYLLWTPFRYPPLRHGSRFGHRHEPSLFYGSLRLATCIGECAYYRFALLAGMASLPTEPIITHHTSFAATAEPQRLADLTAPPFAAFAELQSPCDYHTSQQLGSALRGYGVDAILYASARIRAPDALNLGIFALATLTAGPEQLQSWVCQVEGEQARYLNPTSGEGHFFQRDMFLVDGVLPTPAL